MTINEAANDLAFIATGFTARRCHLRMAGGLD